MSQTTTRACLRTSSSARPTQCGGDRRGNLDVYPRLPSRPGSCIGARGNSLGQRSVTDLLLDAARPDSQAPDTWERSPGAVGSPHGRLRPFFGFYGGKWRDALKHYPAPSHATIVEPFAGSAGYSVRYANRRVVLCELDPVIAGVWRYLIRVKPAEILAIPDLDPDGSIDDLKVCDEASGSSECGSTAESPVPVSDRPSGCATISGPGRFGAIASVGLSHLRSNHQTLADHRSELRGLPGRRSGHLVHRSAIRTRRSALPVWRERH